jgi:hypothetical protein
MLGVTLEEHIKSVQCTEGYFLGVLAANELKSALQAAKPKSFCVANTARNSEEGTHWYTVFKPTEESLEIFDSLGLTEAAARSRVGNVRQCHFNVSQVQLPDSKTCGKFAVYFAIFRVLSYPEPFQDIFEEAFTSDLHKNELIVNDYWEHQTLYDKEDGT